MLKFVIKKIIHAQEAGGARSVCEFIDVGRGSDFVSYLILNAMQFLDSFGPVVMTEE
jgi:hypothetical protein